MAAIQFTLLRFQKLVQVNNLVQRLHNVLIEHFLSDLRVLFQPDQTPGPLVVSAALGTIISFIPAPLLDSLLVGLIIARFRKVNRSILLVARIVWNDLIVLPLYVPGFRFGMRLVEPFSVNETTFAIKIIGFTLGLLFLTISAAMLSAGTMFVFVLILQRWRRLSA